MVCHVSKPVHIRGQRKWVTPNDLNHEHIATRKKRHLQSPIVCSCKKYIIIEVGNCHANELNNWQNNYNWILRSKTISIMAMVEPKIIYFVFSQNHIYDFYVMIRITYWSNKKSNKPVIYKFRIIYSCNEGYGILSHFEPISFLVF